jgi:hypothetical protein
MAGKKNKNQSTKKKKSPGQPPLSPNVIAWEVSSGEYPGVRADAGSCRRPLALHFPTPAPTAGQYPLGTASFPYS